MPLNNDFYRNNLLPSASSLVSDPFLWPAENAFSVLPKRRLLLPFLSLFPLFFSCLAGKGEKIPSRFVVYRVVFNTSESIQQNTRCDSPSGINEVPGNSAGACHAQAPAGSEPGTKPKCLFAGVNYSSTFLIYLHHQRCVVPPGERRFWLGWGKHRSVFVPVHKSWARGTRAGLSTEGLPLGDQRCPWGTASPCPAALSPELPMV